MKTNLIIINNEKCIKKGNNFYCENIEVKSITELLSRSLQDEFRLDSIEADSNKEQSKKSDRPKIVASN